MESKPNLLLYLIAGLSTGGIGIIFYAFQASSIQNFFLAISVALLIAASALMSGASVGFLFGIPRTLQQETYKDNQRDNSNKDFSPELIYQVNTNLEQISDWLTKILVGIGLTQIPEIINAFSGYLDYVDQYGFVGFSNTKVFAGALLIYFLVCGFFTGYLWTRLYLAGAFRQADLDAVGAKLKQVENKVSELEKQAAIDSKALAIVQNQLNPDSDTDEHPINQEKLNNAITPASSIVKAQIFYLATSVRRENWKKHETKAKMERTIPIFRALIESDIKGEYHSNHGQLGYALKDQRIPNWKEACEELTKAIEIRGSWQTNPFLFYEFNRAICKICMDQNFIDKKESSDDVKKSILADLQVAKRSRMITNIISKDPKITEWLTLNNIDITT